MDNVNVMGEVDTITEEQVSEQTRAEQQEKLVPEGWWEGQIITASKVEEDEKSENTQFRGIPQYRVGVKFYDCPESGKVKTAFFNLTTAKILGDGGKPKKAYLNMVSMFKSLNMIGQPATDMLEQAKVTRLKYHIRHFTRDEETQHFLNAVKSV